MVSLDSAIAANKTYMQTKELRLKSLKLLVGKPGMTSEQTYAINGRMMQSVRAKGTFVSRSMQPGIYILRVDNKVQKVAVQ
jgi:hypothetical protein